MDNDRGGAGNGNHAGNDDSGKNGGGCVRCIPYPGGAINHLYQQALRGAHKIDPR